MSTARLHAHPRSAHSSVAALALLAALCGGATSATTPTKLTDSGFEAFRTSADQVLVVFQDGAALPEHLNSLDTVVPYGWLDCKAAESSETCKHFEISTFPAVLYFADKADDQEYFSMPSSETTKPESVLNFVKDKTKGVASKPPASPPAPPAEEEAPTIPEGFGEHAAKVTHLTDTTYRAFRANNPQSLVLWHTPGCQPCIEAKPEFASAAQRLSKSVGFGAILCGQKATEKACTGLPAFPRVEWFGNGTQTDGDFLNPHEYDAQAFYNTVEQNLARIARSSSDDLTDEQLAKMRVKQLVAILKARGVECRGCTEKHDYVARVKATKGVKKAAAAAAAPERKMSVMDERRLREARETAERGWDLNDVKDKNIVETQKKVIAHLTDETYGAWRKANPVSVGMFYVSWCKHCQRIKPTFATGAVAMAMDTKFFAMDCDLNPITTKTHNMTGYPWLAFFDSETSKGDEFQFSSPAEFKQQIRNRQKKLASFEAKPFENKVPEYWEQYSDETTEVDHLTDDNFDDWRATKGKRAVVYMYATWCGYCKDMSPEVAKASAQLKGTVAVGAIDGVENLIMREKFGLKQYPTIMYYDDEHSDGESVALSKIKKAAGFVRHMKSLAGAEADGQDGDGEKAEGWGDDSSEKVVHLRDDNWERFRKKNPKFLIMFYAPWCGACKAAKPDYAKMSAEVSNENDDELKSLPIAAIDCDAETTTCAKYGITGYPTTRFFKSSDAHHKGVETHLRQPADIIKFLSDELQKPVEDEKEDDDEDMEEIDADGKEDDE